jgi:Carboxypeptidase regulatory-like domain
MGSWPRGSFPVALACALLLLMPSLARAQQASPPPRDPTKPPAPQAGTGTIKGRVVALDGGAPLRRVLLTLRGEQAPHGHMTLSDAQGQYEFRKLAAGRYTLRASKGGYVALQYGQRGPRDAGRPIELAERQTLEKIDISLPRGAVITGRVIDEAGEPVADETVLALTYRMSGGKRRLLPVSAGNRGTNDIGQYRIFGLPPGDYYVSASGRPDSERWSGDTDADSDETSGYPPTFYPSTPNPAEAQRVTVGIGEEVVADIQLLPTRVSRVSGAIVLSNGKAPVGGMVALTSRASDVGMFRGGDGGEIRPDGTFALNGISAGSYLLTAVAADIERASSNPSNPQDAIETVTMPITVSGADIGDLRLVTSKGITLSGHLTFEGGTPEALVLKQIMPVCVPVDQETRMFSSQPKPPNEQGEFEIEGVKAPCAITAFGSSEHWSVKSVMLNGVDVTDKPIEPAGKAITGFEITLTKQFTTLTGSVQDAHDQPVKEYVLVAFAEDPERWQPPLSGRYIHLARPDQAGTFKLQGDLPAGRYCLVALEHLDEGAEQDPDFLARLQPLGTRVELTEGGMQSVSLKMSVAPEP